MTTLPRSQIIQPGDTVKLRVLFRGSDGLPADLDAFPAITIIEPSGGVVAGPTSAGVFREAVGTYGFDYDVGLMPALGVWRDIWQGTLNGFAVSSEFLFVVNTTQMPAINTDGYIHLGDDVGFNYSQNAIANINMMLKLLRARLKSRGKHKSTDEFGNTVYTDCDVYDVNDLTTFLVMSLGEFNETPTFTTFTFDDTPIMQEFYGILVQGATLMALSSQSIIERGREMQITDNGVGFTPPTISEIMNTQWNAELTNWYDRVKLIKHNMKPSPYGLGTIRMGSSPQFRRLRHLRARQIY